MKRNAFALLLTLSLMVSAIPGASAVVTPGSKCSKVGINQTFNGFTYTCKKAGSKLVWSQGVRVQVYDAAFARSHLSETQERASQILAEAKAKAGQISSPPNCTARNSTASVSLGADGIDNLLSLIFNNPGICDITIRASAAFLCPDGGVQKTSNYVTSTGIFPLRAGEKLSVALNVSYYFPQVLNECRSLTRYPSSSVRISTYHQPPSVMTLTSNYAGNFNQVEATKKANDVIKNAQDRADKMIADAKNPVLISNAWKAAAEAKIAADAKAVADAKAAAEAKIAADAKAVADAKAAADKAAADAKAAADKAAADARAVAECAKNGRSCEVGNTGPGGGIVFYDAGSQQSWGRYLEFAPSGWSGNTEDPEPKWCDVNSVLSTQVGVGTGKANTELMVAGCSSGAAVIVRAYKGGGKDDWFLPSKDELNELCKYARGQATGNPKISCTSSGTFRKGFVESYYRSSSEASSRLMWIQTFSNGFQGNQASKDIEGYRVRPVRAF
jgi:hypothetical protein